MVPLAAAYPGIAMAAVPLLRLTKALKLWPSKRKATVPVGVGLPEEPVAIAVRVKVWPRAGLAELEVSVTVGVNLLASEMMVPPLAALPSQLLSPW